MIEGFGAMPDEVMVRFGMWDAILAAPQPDKPYMPFTNAFHHAARATAFAAKEDTQQARAEQKTVARGHQADSRRRGLPQQSNAGHLLACQHDGRRGNPCP